MTHTHLYQTSVWNKGRERGGRGEEEGSEEGGEKTVGGKEDKREKMKLMSMRCARLTFSILQQKENCIFRDDKLFQLHHVGHRVRHDRPLRPPTVTAPPQPLQ